MKWADALHHYKTLQNLLIFGLIFLPFTSLRFGVVGIGEILILLSLLLLLIFNKGKIQPLPKMLFILRFWIIFIILVFLGLSYNLIFLNYMTGDIIFALFDLSSYLYVFILLLLLSDKKFYTGISPYIFFRKIFYSWGIVFSLLFILSQFSASIFGFSLRYYSSYAPLVANVHQSAMITSVMPFIMAFFAVTERSFLFRVFGLILSFTFIAMVLDTSATKAWLAMLVGAVFLVFFALFHRKKGRLRFYLNGLTYLSILISFLFVFSIYFAEISLFAKLFFIENDGGNARSDIYSSGLLHALESPIFGYGPGPQIEFNGKFYDAHNTILTVSLHGGFLALISFIIFYRKLFIVTTSSYFLISAVGALSIYALGGDVLRRLPVWVILIGLVLLSPSNYKTNPRVDKPMRL